MNTSLDLDRINELKKLLLETGDLASLWEFFFIHLAEHPRWFDMGEKRDDLLLEGIVTRIAQKHLKFAGTTSATISREIESYRFRYGVSLMGSHQVGYFYFDDIDVGSMIVASANGYTMRYARFSVFTGGGESSTFPMRVVRRVNN